MKVHDVPVDGCRLRVREAGRGPALVLLHGLSGSHEIWHRTIDAFADRWRVIAPDLPGHGESDKPNAPYTPDFYAGMIRSLGRTLGVDEAVVAGVSLGGRIALELGVGYPGWTRALVLCAPAATYPAAMRAVGWALGVAMRAPVLRITLPRGVERCFADPSCAGVAERRRILERRLGSADWPQFAAAVARSVRGVVTAPRPALTTLRQPTLIVWGREDRIVRLATLGPLEHAVPHARVVVLDRCGHLPMLERPAEFHAAVEGFLGVAAAAPRLVPPHSAAGGR